MRDLGRVPTVPEQQVSGLMHQHRCGVGQTIPARYQHDMVWGVEWVSKGAGIFFAGVPDIVTEIPPIWTCVYEFWDSWSQ